MNTPAPTQIALWLAQVGYTPGEPVPPKTVIIGDEHLAAIADLLLLYLGQLDEIEQLKTKLARPNNGRNLAADNDTGAKLTNAERQRRKRAKAKQKKE